MNSKRIGRGKNPSNKTKNMLYIAAGGRCQMCNKEVFYNEMHCKHINSSNVAHIIGASEDGPRGNEMSLELSQNIGNLMLLCPECHILIDSHPNDFTVDTLRGIKNKQEESVSIILKTLDKPKTTFLILYSKIRNRGVTIDINDVIKAIIADKMVPDNRYGITIEIDEVDYSSNENWDTINKKIESKVLEYNSVFKNCENMVLSVFPLAPIPIIIKFAYILSDKRKISVFQKFREPDTWIWKSDENTNTFSFKEIYPNNTGRIALLISLSSEVNISRVASINTYNKIYVIEAERTGIDSILSKKDLEAFCKLYLDVCNLIKNRDDVDEIDIYPVVPVSAAFEIGRRYMDGVFPRFNIYEENNGFKKTITIGVNRNDR